MFSIYDDRVPPSPNNIILILVALFGLAAAHLLSRTSVFSALEEALMWWDDCCRKIREVKTKTMFYAMGFVSLYIYLCRLLDSSQNCSLYSAFVFDSMRHFSDRLLLCGADVVSLWYASNLMVQSDAWAQDSDNSSNWSGRECEREQVTLLLLSSIHCLLWMWKLTSVSTCTVYIKSRRIFLSRCVFGLLFVKMKRGARSACRDASCMVWCI